MHNYHNCLKRLEQYTNVQVLNIGLSDTNQNVALTSDGERSRICDNGSGKVCIRKLDDINFDSQVAMIKMDVEGEELKIIKGAERIIKEQKPILAISIYHKLSDIFLIPRELIKLVREYYFGLRHYTSSYGDTVLYAVYRKE